MERALWGRDKELGMKRYLYRSLFASAVVLAGAALFSCASLKINPLPEPGPTAKLRVYVEAFSIGPAGRKWSISHEEFAQNQIRRTGKFLEKTGIYEVVPASDVRVAIGEQVLNYYSMERDSWSQARTIGKALHADYVLVVAREKSNIGTGEWTMFVSTELVNVASGKAFKSRYSVGNVIPADQVSQAKLIRETYRDLFRQAKQDMFAMAVKKGRAYAPPAGPQDTPVIAQPATPKAEAASPALSAQGSALAKKEDVPAAAKTIMTSPNLPGAGLFEEPKRDPGAKKLVVYDLESNDQYQTVALILAEALREEVFKLKQFVLVNREDLQKVLEEMALQQTGLIDEKQAVKTGQGLAASQVVTGRLGQLGKVFVMQAKRVDVETFGTLGLASIKFTEGQEDEVLNRLPGFAKELVGLR